MANNIIESVWDYPRPPKLEATSRHLKVIFAEEMIADSRRAYRVLETSHPPTYYIPRDDIRTEFLADSSLRTFCEFKGQANYLNLLVADRRSENAAWFYSDPQPVYSSIRGYIAFYAGRVDACFVDDERVQVQVGDFYGGWITSNLKGPFKGGAGTWGW
jgi:uncharacterized protein (DUF427 family)